jgi:hypothetical protein
MWGRREGWYVFSKWAFSQIKVNVLHYQVAEASPTNVISPNQKRINVLILFKITTAPLLKSKFKMEKKKEW